MHSAAWVGAAVGAVVAGGWVAGVCVAAVVGAVDAPQRTEFVDKPDEFAQVLIHTPSSPEPLGIMAFSAIAGTGSVQERSPLRKIRVNIHATQDIRRRGLW